MTDAIVGPILVVEDSKTQQMVLLRQLEGAGVSADAVPTVAEAVAAVENENYLLVLTDFHLPDGTALELVPMLKERFRGPVICLTASEDERDERAVRAAGADEVLTKPIELAQMWWMLDRWIGPAFDDSKFEQLATDIGRGDVLAKILSTFATELPLRVAAMAAADRVGDEKTLRHEAHTLKSGAALVGATGLAGWCAYLSESDWTRTERHKAVRRVRSLAAATEAEVRQRHTPAS